MHGECLTLKPVQNVCSTQLLRPVYLQCCEKQKTKLKNVVRTVDCSQLDKSCTNPLASGGCTACSFPSEMISPLRMPCLAEEDSYINQDLRGVPLAMRAEL